MPWPGLLALPTVTVEDGTVANSDPSVSITEPSAVNVAKPGIPPAKGVGVDVTAVTGIGVTPVVKVNCHEPAKDGVAADAG